MDDDEVAADQDGARDRGQVQFVFFPDAHSVAGRAVSAERFDPVGDPPNGEGIGLCCQEPAYRALVENAPPIRVVQRECSWMILCRSAWVAS